jgi:hypothetical protein
MMNVIFIFLTVITFFATLLFMFFSLIIFASAALGDEDFSDYLGDDDAR